MKNFLYLAAIACMVLFASCGKENVEPQNEDEKEQVVLTGNLYDVWALTTKSETSTDAKGNPTVSNDDYTSCHFYLAFGEFPFPHAIAKKGNLSSFDLDDVDVDAVMITYNPDTHQITFEKMLWLSDEWLTRNMVLSGKFDVTELSDTQLVIRLKEPISGNVIAYSFTRQN